MHDRINRRWTGASVAGIALGVGGLLVYGFRGLVLAVAALSFAGLTEVVRTRHDSTSIRRDVAIVALTLASAGSLTAGLTWSSLTSARHSNFTTASRAAIKEVVDELLHDGRILEAAEQSKESFDAESMSFASYKQNEGTLAATLPFQDVNAVEVFYTYAIEVTAEPGSLAGHEAVKAIHEMRHLLKNALDALLPYIE
jgi:hypothetical protein